MWMNTDKLNLNLCVWLDFSTKSPIYTYKYGLFYMNVLLSDHL